MSNIVTTIRFNYLDYEDVQTYILWYYVRKVDYFLNLDWGYQLQLHEVIMKSVKLTRKQIYLALSMFNHPDNKLSISI